MIRLLLSLTILACLANEAAARGPFAAGEIEAARIELARYRESARYLREPLRPQFHFTPERNWMNDPNGLVFHRGEYHLFYQHNPVGNAWGHMSWGHAVSPDLVRWEHLPIAILEEQDEMIFSGSCVIDHNNTSGFGTADNPPMVAIYTAHRSGNQAQSLAYSTDNGRTWTKHAGNPVLDLGEADFRDPKVFWHEPTERWVMVVSLAIAKRLQIYGSDDLKQWTLLSEFGPAGVDPKPNWECPDLFELTIEDAAGKPTGETRWVLEVDMGDGAIAGGSGGEYFVGSFDGERFVCDDPNNAAHWVDFGRDFYAPVSWSDVPSEDGRRIWIGWMNNWQTHLLPTSPWRSAMSVPRSLALRKTSDGLQLVQKPVEELKTLRRDQTNLLEDDFVGRQLELELVAQPVDDQPIRLSVLKGEEEATVIGYDPRAQQLYVDRTHSGQVDFHEAFAGVHRAPLKLNGKPLRLRVLVDRSSVEVFAQDGLVVITDRVFPAESSVGITLDAPGADVKSFQGWRMASSWRDD
ncbi:Levanase precursor [Planctomycetes bacterium MalM25]|nr:Levanase precursor [Planctomycetes bacterium MalM25]